MSAQLDELTPPDLTSRHPELGTGPLPTDIYHKPEIFERELEAIFKRTWTWVGRVEQVKDPGQFFLREIRPFGFSVIICRDDNGEIQAFYNTCRHRGHPVEIRESGVTKRFTCAFHAWTYGLKGELRGVPDEAGFPNLCKPALGLRKVPVAVWEGFIFVYPDDEPEQSLTEFLGEQGADLVGYPFDQLRETFSFAAEIKANWKCIVDAFGETYHLPALHRRSVAPTIAGPKNPSCRLLDVRLKGPHRTISAGSNPDFQPSHAQGLAYANAPGAAITSGRTDGAFEFPKGLNQTRHEMWSIDVTHFFPTFLMSMGTGMYFSHQIWPLAPNRSRYEVRAFLKPAQTAGQRFAQEHALVELRDTLLEDTSTLERTQRALDAGIIREFVFHDHELAVRHHYHTVMKWLDDYQASCS